jgi:hypothetical protein
MDCPAKLAGFYHTKRGRRISELKASSSPATVMTGNTMAFTIVQP